MSMKKWLDKIEQFLVISMMWCIIYSYIALFLLPIIGVTGYFIIVILMSPRFMLHTLDIRYYWDHIEDCPTVYWCEKLTVRLFNGKTTIRKN